MYKCTQKEHFVTIFGASFIPTFIFEDGSGMEKNLHCNNQLPLRTPLLYPEVQDASQEALSLLEVPCQ